MPGLQYYARQPAAKAARGSGTVVRFTWKGRDDGLRRDGRVRGVVAFLEEREIMAKRILIVGGGGNQIGFVRKAKDLGLFTGVIDGSAEAPGLHMADMGATANIRDPEEVTAAAERFHADGVFPAAEAGVEAAAAAAERLGLPGPGVDAARCCRNKLAMRERLTAQGLPGPAYASAATVTEAEAAAARFGFPLIVKPADGNASRGVQAVNTAEDVSYAFTQAYQHARGGGVLLESFLEGEEYCVDGLVHEGRFHLGGVTGKERSAPPYRYDVGIFMPPPLAPDAAAAIETCVRDALDAIGFRCGTVHAEVIVTADGPRIVEIAGRPGGGRIPTDLIWLAHGHDFAADALGVALGRAPRGARLYERGAALYWTPGAAGQVTAVTGVDQARQVPGVKEVVIMVKPGDVLGDTVDCSGRDQVGYVLAAGDNTEAAVTAAKRARDLCAVLTRRAAS